MSIEKMTADVERQERSAARPDYHWWTAADWKTLSEGCNKAIEGHDGECVIECRRGMSAEGYPNLWIVVCDAESGEVIAALNWSHPCPPFCPREK